jgi:L-glyceraldehyde 3-phosphate reductase
MMLEAHLPARPDRSTYLETIPDGARAQNSSFLSPEVIDDTYRRRTAELNKPAESCGQSLAQLALQWVLRKPEVTSALIGVHGTGLKL